MALNTKTFTIMVQDWVAAAQGASSALLDFTIGSILRAIAEAQAGVALWLQGLVLKVLITTRLATSSGADVDSFVADFGLTRLPSVTATGSETFSRFTPTNAALVPVGAIIQTSDGTQSFSVVADASQAAWSESLNGYVIEAGVSSVVGTVQAISGGAGGNISAGTLTVLQTGISGVDTVTNSAGFTNGVDAESDAALKTRFVAFFNSLSKATLGAFQYAIASLQQGLQYQIIENKLYNGTTDNGMVTVIVDDGSGNTPAAVVSAVYTAIDAVRAAGVRIGVFAATKVNATVVMTIGVSPGFMRSAVQSNVAAAVTAAVNATGLGNTLDYMRLGQAAFNVPGVAAVTGVTLNGGTADLAATKLQTIKALSVTVNLAA